jgi:hypothetical protein
VSCIENAMRFESALLGMIQREMGPAAFIRFQQIFFWGSVAYTEERHTWLDNLTAEEIVRRNCEERG